MIDVVHLATAVSQLHQNLDHIHDVFIGKHHGAFGTVAAHAGVEFHAAHTREIVAVFAVEQAVEQRLHGIFGRRLARAHHAVDRDARGHFISRFVHAQGLADVGALIQFVGIDAGNFLHTGFTQLLEQGFGQLVVGLGDDLARILVNDVGCQHTPDEEVLRHADVLRLGRLQLANVLGRDALVLGDNHVALLVGNVEACHFTLEALGHKGHLRAAVLQTEVVVHEEGCQDLLGRQANGLEQNRHGHLAAAVYAEIENILGIEFEIKPGTTVRNDPRAEQQFATGVRFALVVLEEHAGRAVQLAHNHALGTVDDERAFVGHERHFTHVHLLLFHFFHDLGLRRGSIAVVNDQLHARTHGRTVRQAAGLALAHIERGLGQVVFEKFHLDKTVVRNDRESSLERCLQAFRLAFSGRHICLQESRVGIALHLQQIGNLQHVVAAAKTLANAFAFGKCVGHEYSR